MQNFISWLGQSSVAQAIQISGWMFPTIESVHVIAISLVVGVIAIMDLRLLGLTSGTRAVTAVSRDTLPWVWAAFVLAVISGALMFVSNAETYYNNRAFLIKMGLMVLAGINMLVFELITFRSVAQWDRDVSLPAPAKIAAALSLSLWIGVVVFGRLIGFTLDFFSGGASQYLTTLR
ncbi:DUF6644 family protein [Sinorhizobium mexicanum]|uniref:Uncharacterized protein n=1 Tax=Sinorhizobium mexicanum TaxID=375549 RepID=A0A859R249_9HYPH|nr:DUF6644 family protein [Sinorhizobium mexicanum]MBP1884361.1 putative membrane protein [Sinorhizobium mexicanum]QLL65041.1 hypothetical protein FKV68_27120 [Sinorhizobium mexicanum]